MARWSNNEIEHPEAYANAIKASIHGRANAKRARAWEAAHPHLAAWANYHGYDEQTGKFTKHPLGSFPTFARDAINKWGAPTEKATATLQRIFDERTVNAAKRAEERAAEAASAQAWQPGRQVVEGTIISVKEVESSFGPRWSNTPSYSWKMLVKRQDGSKIYTTIPAQLEGRAEDMRGKQVRFTVTVEPKEGEPTFAFGKRPAKAEFITPTQEQA